MLNSGQDSTAVSLFDVIARIESKGFKGAMRFEPATYDNFQSRLPRDAGYTARAESVIHTIMTANRCSKETARIIWSTSWGAAQIMGFNLYAYELHFGGSIAEYLTSDTAQRMTFSSFCGLHSIMATPAELAGNPSKRFRFASVYNGSSNYLGPLCDSLRFHGFVIVSEDEYKSQNANPANPPPKGITG